MRRRVVIGLVAVMGGTAYAGKHRVERGETLEHVAQSYGCSTEAVLAANGLDTTIVPPGTLVVIPTCNMKTRARSREVIRGKKAKTEEQRAAQALAVIDGASIVEETQELEEAEPTRLQQATELRETDGIKVRRPTRAFGEAHVVEHLSGAIAAVRALYPDVHTLAIGDLSAKHGGKLANHLSHQTGLDVDVGFYFTKVPDGYPEHFVAANSDLDLSATWALITAFSRTTHLADGVSVIFLDRAVQQRLYKWAKGRGTPADQLASLLQVAGGSDALVRHWPNHDDHLHVRFKQP